MVTQEGLADHLLRCANADRGRNRVGYEQNFRTRQFHDQVTAVVLRADSLAQWPRAARDASPPDARGNPDGSSLAPDRCGIGLCWIPAPPLEPM